MQNENFYPQILAKAAILEVLGKINLTLNYRHNCSKKLMGQSSVNNGFPNLPLICPHCGERLLNYDGMSFSFAVNDVEIPDPSNTQGLAKFLEWMDEL